MTGAQYITAEGAKAATEAQQGLEFAHILGLRLGDDIVDCLWSLYMGSLEVPHLSGGWSPSYAHYPPSSREGSFADGSKRTTKI